MARTRFLSLPVGPYELQVTLDGFTTYVQDGIVLQVGTNPSDQRDLDHWRRERAGQRDRRRHDGRVAQHRCRAGHRFPAGDRAAAERPAGDRARLLSGLATPAPTGRSSDEQELPDGDHLGGGRRGERHHLHHGRRLAQRSVQQPEPADAVSRRASGVQGRDELAAGALRSPCRGCGECDHPSPARTASDGVAFDFSRHYRFNEKSYFALEKDSLRRQQFGGTLGGPIIENRAVLLRGLSGQGREDEADDGAALRADGGDAGR